MINIEINNETYKVEVADTEELREKGLQNVHYLPQDEGMLFVFDEPTVAGFWMKDTYIPLDILFIDEYGEVKAKYTGEPENEEIFEVDDIKYVLEVNSDSDISVGDDVDLSELEDFDIDEEDDEDELDEHNTMLVLDEDGKTQVELKGGERIFSRKNTKTLVRLSKRAYKSKSDADYKALGRKVFQYIDIQNNKEEDYVEIP